MISHHDTWHSTTGRIDHLLSPQTRSPTSQIGTIVHNTTEQYRLEKEFTIKDSTFYGIYSLENRFVSGLNCAMAALKAVAFAPISGFAKRSETRKIPSLATISATKNQTCSSFRNSESVLSVSGSLQGCSVLLSSVLNAGLAGAVTYDEALQQSVSSSSFSSDFDFNGVLDSVLGFAAENPIIIGGAAAVLAVPLVVSQLFSKPKPWGVESAKTAYAKLSDDSNAQLLDVRGKVDLKQVGSPDIRGLKKQPVSIAYRGEDKPGFLSKLYLKFKEPENTTLFILDKFDGNSELVAELVTANGFKAAYAIKDGAEGSRGWKNSRLPWILPKKTLNLGLGNLTDAIGGALGEGSDAVPVILGVAAAVALGFLAFTEVETILQVLGSAALIQIVSTKLLFAEDRKQTILEVEEFLDTKIVAKDLVIDIQQIGSALLPFPVTSKSLAAPADTSVQKSEPIPEVNSVPPKVEAAPEPIPAANSVPKEEIQKESLPGIPRPLSPYTNYPDFKPPSSPIPSQA